MSRRRFLQVAGLGAAAVAVDGLLVEPRWLDVTRHEVVVERLPAALDGFVIVQLTDLHLRKLGKLHEDVVAAIRREAPGMIVCTGDMVEDRAGLPLLDELCGELEGLAPSILATLGNWEHWGGVTPAELARLYRGRGARLLVNESVRLDAGLEVAATDDGLAGSPNLQRSVERLRSDAPFRLMLTHSPALLDQARRSPAFDLVLAGHTHGGQMRVGSWAPVRPPGSGRFVSGFYETPLGQAYVSRGLGTSIVPVRMMCRPELAVFVLRRAG